MLKEISGQGYYDGKGKVTVKYQNDIKIFDDFDLAKIFYDTLNCDKAIWQENPTELVCSHIVV